MEMTKCVRCAVEYGAKNLEEIDKHCIWKAGGTKCPDYDERPDMESIRCEKIPSDETKILRRQMRLLAEKSRFANPGQIVEVSEAMLKLHKRLLIQPIIRFFGFQMLFGIGIGFFVAVNDFIKSRR